MSGLRRADFLEFAKAAGTAGYLSSQWLIIATSDGSTHKGVPSVVGRSSIILKVGSDPTGFTLINFDHIVSVKFGSLIDAA